MGEINLLKASYTKKVGTTYGVKQYGKAIVKAVPFSHTPHNQKQKNALTAFTKLNRVASNIARVFWDYLGFSDKTMYKNNVISKWLKPCLQNNNFVIDNIAQVIPADGSLRITQNTYDTETRVFDVIIKNTPEAANYTDENIYIGIITTDGIIKLQQVRQGVEIHVSGKFSTVDFNSYRVFCFKSVKKSNKYIIKGFAITPEASMPIVENHIIYTDRADWHVQPYVLNHTLYISSQDAEKILHLLKFNITRRN